MKLPDLSSLPLPIKSELVDIIGYHSAFKKTDKTSTSHTVSKEMLLLILPYLLEVYNKMTIDIKSTSIIDEEVKITIPYI